MDKYTKQDLIDIVTQNKINDLKKAIQEGVDIHQDIYHNNLLSYSQSYEMDKFLLEQGLDPNSPAQEISTIFNLLASRINDIQKKPLKNNDKKIIKIVELFLKFNLSSNTINGVLHLIEDEDTLDLLLENGGQIDEAFITQSCSVDNLRLLDKKGFDIINWRDPKEKSNLLYFMEHLDMLQYLLDKGLDPNNQNINGECVLHYIVTYPHIGDFDNILDLLLEYGIDINILDNENRSPIFYVYNPQILNKMIDCGARVDITDIHGECLEDKISSFYLYIKEEDKKEMLESIKKERARIDKIMISQSIENISNSKTNTKKTFKI